ncbi:nuclear transport factor 2 family protein [Falsiroseomonas sp. HW251]|uniref:nuclear transport factor 2 family protein n=1 Tax=Falsiroseomonas sp. HW251 TaxID=3390998 RepID=UPI003D317D32
MSMALREFGDRIAIAEVLARYCRHLDEMNLDGIPPLFTRDCLVSYGPDPLLESHGAEALARSLQRLWRWSRTSHHLSNIEISFDDDAHARVRSYVIAWHERDDGSTATLFGSYCDEFLRDGEIWRIARRRQEMHGSDAGFRVNLHRLARRPPPRGWQPPQIDGR